MQRLINHRQQKSTNNDRTVERYKSSKIRYDDFPATKTGPRCIRVFPFSREIIACILCLHATLTRASSRHCCLFDNQGRSLNRSCAGRRKTRSNLSKVNIYMKESRRENPGKHRFTLLSYRYAPVIERYIMYTI